MSKSNRPRVAQKKCAFCGGGGTPGNKMSKEHIWPNWMRSLIPRSTYRTEQLTDNFGNLLPGTSVDVRTGDVHTKKIKAVCQKCNNGWMSAIVEKAKPHVEKIVQGQVVLLSTQDQSDLTSFFSLIAMMADLAAKARHKIPAADLKRMYEQKMPPIHWFVGVGYYTGFQLIGHNHNSFALGEPGPVANRIVGNAKSMAHVQATILGHLFVLVQVNSTAKTIPHSAIEQIYAPYVLGIQPHIGRTPFRFPQQKEWTITGSFFPAQGGLAFDIATRLGRELGQALARST